MVEMMFGVVVGLGNRGRTLLAKAGRVKLFSLRIRRSWIWANLRVSSKLLGSWAITEFLMSSLNQEINIFTISPSHISEVLLAIDSKRH